MKLSLVLACIWVVASAITAMLPMRHQAIPGLPLLIAAPVLIYMLGRDFGVWLVLIGLFALASMFRNPLIYFYRKARGLPVELPPELQERRK